MRTDNASSKFIANLGGDWWLSSTAQYVDGFANNPGIGGSTFVALSTSYRYVYYTNLTSSQLQADPPPPLKAAGTTPSPAPAPTPAPPPAPAPAPVPPPAPAPTPSSAIYSAAASQFQNKPVGALMPDGTWNIWGNGAISNSVSFPASASYTFVVNAYGSYAGGAWPIMQVQIDGKVVGQVTVSSSTLSNYAITASVSAGTHTVGIAFSNDYYGGTATTDRNLFVKTLTITRPTTTTPTSSTVFSAPATQFQNKPVGASMADGTWNIWANGAISNSVSFSSSSSYTFVVNAYGSNAGGAWPTMQIQIDGQSVGEVSVSSSTLANYTIKANVAAGSHQVGIAFTNDYYGGTSTTDRNLYVKTLTITTP